MRKAIIIGIYLAFFVTVTAISFSFN